MKYFNKPFYNYSTNEILKILKNESNVKVPLELILSNNFIKEISHTSNISQFYYNISLISKQVSPYPFIEEHKRFCDKQVLFNNNVTKKYIISLFISKCFEIEPSILLENMRDLFNFSKENNINLKGSFIYKFLLNYEKLDKIYVLFFYKVFSNYPIKDILYDDFSYIKERFINEVNENVLDYHDCKLEFDYNGVPYYDITETDKCLIVSNTSVPLYYHEISRLISKIKKGKIHSICLSIQDAQHESFYNDFMSSFTIKFLYNRLEAKKVGIISEEDAYSRGDSVSESEDASYKTHLYTLRSFLESTKEYNEIKYLINGNPFKPIGVLCEYGIKEEEVFVAREMGIPIFFRKQRNSEVNSLSSVNALTKKN